MSTLTLSFCGRDYAIACDDGQESHLNQLAHQVNERIRDLSKQIGRQNESMMLVMTCLMMADEITDKERENSKLREQVHSLLENSGNSNSLEMEQELAEQKRQLHKALENLSDKLETVALELEQKAV